MNGQKANKQFSIAIIFYYLLLLSAFIVIFKLVYFNIKEQFVEEEKKLTVTALQQIEKETNIKVNRGSIISCDGEILAASVPVYKIALDLSPTNVSDNDFNLYSDSLAYYLAKHFPVKTKEQYLKLFKEIRRDSIQYKPLFAKVEYKELKLLETFPLFKKGRNGGGLIAEDYLERVKLYGDIASRLIGHYREHSTKIGIEAAYNNYLSGIDGKRIEKRVARGVYVPKNEDYIIPPREGLDVVATIDTRIQQVAHNALKKQLINQQADWGCAIVMEVETGEVKAMVNLEISDSTYQEKVNKAISHRYEPGSTFKTFAMMIMLEDNNLDLNELVDTGNGIYTLCKGKDTIKDSDPLGIINAREVFEHSSNIGTTKLILARYLSNPMKYVNKLIAIKLTKKLGIDIVGELTMIINNNKKDCLESRLATMSYGYSVSITPLQLLAYYNAIANNGKLMRPLFVKEIKDGEHTIEKFLPVILHHRICKPETAKTLQDLMHGVVENGTAKGLKGLPCKVGGKTGTAAISGKRGYGKSAYNASFAGFFPVESPKYSCIVVVNNPKKSIYGASVALPVFKEIVEIIYATSPEIQPNEEVEIDLNNIYPLIHKTRRASLEILAPSLFNNASVLKMPQAEWITFSQSTNPKLNNESFQMNTIPDVRMMNVKDAIYLLEKFGLTVSVSGRGLVKHQSIAPNTKIENINKKHIHLTLKAK